VFDYGTSGWVSRYLTHASFMVIKLIMAYGSVIIENATLRIKEILNMQRDYPALRFAQFLIGSWRGNA